MTNNINTNNSNDTTNTADNSTAAVVETPVLSKFDIDSTEKALALYLDAKAGREAIEEELANHELYMSSICKEISAKFGNGPFDLGDGNPRGHIIVKRGDLYFIRGRNSGRPVGSGKKSSSSATASSSQAVANEVPAALAAVMADEDDGDETAFVPTELSKLSPMEQALAVADAEIAEREAAMAAMASLNEQVAE